MDKHKQVQPGKAVVTKDSDPSGMRIWVMPLGNPLKAVKEVAEGKENLE